MRRYKKDDGFGRYAAALLGGLLCAVPFLLLSALLVRMLGRLPAAVLRIPAVLGWGTAAFVFGWRVGVIRRRHLLAAGMVCGGLIGCLRLVGTFFFGSFSTGMLWGLFWMALLGGIGGVTGVNAPRWFR